jgi:predicted small lipoprotein YifL
MKKIFGLILSIVLLMSLAACAPNGELPPADSQMQLTTPGPNPAFNTVAENGRIAGLGTGLWHGLISVVTLLISFTNPDVQMYEVHNTGPLYNLGFLLGAILFAILGYSGGSRRRR